MPIYVQRRAAVPVRGGDGDKGGRVILQAQNVELLCRHRGPHNFSVRKTKAFQGQRRVTAPLSICG